MLNQQLLSPGCVVAKYTPQRLPQYKGNPLVEALPPSLSEEQLYQALCIKPDFAAEQRTWTVEERLQMLEGLRTFLVPMARHIELARSLDAMLRAGYVGRAPRTPEHTQRYQAIYDRKQVGTASAERLLESPGQISALLMGISGMGKTTMVKHWFSLMPQVIFHRELNVYQVTHLHVEMPSDGSSIKGLAHGILNQIDKLIPGANYYETYAARGKPGADTLMRSVARVLNMHHVGFLVADEIQNLANSHKSKQTVMTELVSACNELGLPILFIGTNKAEKVFSLDFRQSRRASGRGISEWSQLAPSSNPNEVDEWDDFLTVLWTYQWVRKPVVLDAQFRTLMHHYSQGVLDVAIKLFASAQARAMLDGSEAITPGILEDVYKKELRLLHPMLDAMRNGDLSRLAEFEDISPIGLHEMLTQVASRVRAKASSAHRLRTNNAAFSSSIATALVATGYAEDEALKVAEEVAADTKVKNLAQGTKAGIELLSTPKRVPSKKAKLDETDRVLAEFKSALAERPTDYRNAILQARLMGTSVHEQLQRLGMVAPLESLLELC